MKRKNFYILIIIFLGISILMIFQNCKKQFSQDKKSVIIGKIVNPKKDYFIVSQDPFNLTSDTIYASLGNKFQGKISTPKEGLFFVYIFPEFQTFYLKPGDSLAFVLNTNEFDESLSFSGTSGLENNILINLFLINEKESIELHKSFAKLTPEELLKKTDSFYKIKNQFIASYKPEYDRTSKHFKQVVDFYKRLARCRILESYAEKHKRELPKNYFDYRKILKEQVSDPNIPDILYFIRDYIDNNIPWEPHQNFRQKQIVELINKNIKDQKVKDNILMLYCQNYLKSGLIADTNDHIFQLYLHSIKNVIYKKHCLNLLLKNQKLQAGNILPEVTVIDLDGKLFPLKKILKPNRKYLLSFSDLYFRKNYKTNYTKLKQIKELYPSLHILIINKNAGDYNEWKIQVPKDSSITFLQFQNEKSISKIFPYNLTKIYLLQHDSIIHSMINMYQPDFSEVLKNFIEK